MKKFNSLLFLAFLVFSLILIFPVKSNISPSILNSPSIQDSIIMQGTNWTVGCFSCHNQTLNYIGMEGFDYSLTNDSIHFVENGGIWPNPYGTTSYTSVGAYTTFPTIDGNLVIDFNARARANHVDAVLMGIRIYDPDSMTWLMSSASHPEEIPDIISPGLDSGWLEMTINVTVPGLDELTVFWSFNDFFIADWKQEFWVENITVVTEEPYEEISPVINGLNMKIIEENYNVQVNWTVYDENPEYHQIYLNGDLNITANWTSTDDISITFENLTYATHNITLIAYDIYGNFAISSVIFVVELKITITPYPILIISLLSLVFVSFIITKRNKK